MPKMSLLSHFRALKGSFSQGETSHFKVTFRSSPVPGAVSQRRFTRQLICWGQKRLTGASTHKICPKQGRRKSHEHCLSMQARAHEKATEERHENGLYPASTAIFSDPFRLPTRSPNSTCWDEVASQAAWYRMENGPKSKNGEKIGRKIENGSRPEMGKQLPKNGEKIEK